MIDSFIYRTISISKCNPLAGTSYIKLPKELDHPRKGLINIQNTNNNECYKWYKCYRRVTKADKDFAKRLILKT